MCAVNPEESDTSFFNILLVYVKADSPVMAFAPVTVTNWSLVDPVKTALADAVPVKFPTNVVAVTTPDITCGPPTI